MESRYFGMLFTKYEVLLIQVAFLQNMYKLATLESSLFYVLPEAEFEVLGSTPPRPVFTCVVAAVKPVVKPNPPEINIPM